MKRVLLVYPRNGQEVLGVNVGLPLSVMYVGTCLEQAGYEVKIVDERTCPDFERELENEIDRGALFAGISSMTGPQIAGGLRAAAVARRANPRLPIVWGGVHPSLCPDSTLENPYVDFVVVNEGEHTTIELAQALEEGGGFEKVRGIGYKVNGAMKFTALREMLDLDTLPPLNYDLVEAENYYTVGHILREKQLQMITSRGCPFRCDYCYNLLYNDRKFRYQSPERMISDLKYVVGRFGVRGIFFFDDYFFGNRHRVERFIDLLEAEDLHLQFEVSCRSDYLDKCSDQFLSRLKRWGFEELLIGTESGSERIMEEISKDFTVDQTLRTNRRMANLGMSVKYSFIAGFPGETREEVLMTVKFMLQLLRENPHASITPLGIYTPYPGTPLYDRVVKEYGGRMPERLEDWARCDWQNNYNEFIGKEQMGFIRKLNVISRFFDVRAFERFGSQRFEHLVMSLYHLYHSILRLRVKFDFYAFMPEVKLLDFFQDLYVRSTHRRLLKAFPASRPS